MDFGILEFLNAIYIWLTEGIYAFFTELVTWALKKYLIYYYETTKWGLEFAWGIAESLIDELNLSEDLMTAFSALPLSTQQILSFFKIPEFLNLMMSALGTRLVLKYVPFI